MATYFLNADTGNDSTGAGTSGNPYLTIAKALTLAVAGDTITLQHSTAHFTWATATIQTGLTINAAVLGDAIIDASAGSVRWTMNGTTTLTNLRFTNAIASSNLPLFEITTSTNLLTITTCQFDNLQGFDANAAAVFHSNAATMTMTGCLFYAITTASGGSASTIFRGNGQITHTMTNCTFYVSGTGTAKLESYFNGTNAGTFTNCIFQNAGDAMSFFAHFAPVVTITNSCSFGNSSSGVTLVNSITTDPQFIAPGSANFNLKPTSPCIETGVIF